MKTQELFEDTESDMRNNMSKSETEDYDEASSEAKKYIHMYRKAGLRAKHALYNGIDAADNGWTATQVRDDIKKNVK